MNYLIYLLKADTIPLRHLPPGTALIGGVPEKDGLISVHYQERIPNNPEMDSYAWRLYHAADRRYSGAPTHRLCGVMAEDVIMVGRYDASRGVVLEFSDPQSVEALSGETAAAVLGRRYKAGPLTQRKAEGLHRETRAWQLYQANNVWLIRTQGGQVLQSDCRVRGACIHTLWNHNDAELPEILRKAGVAERVIARVVGALAFGEVKSEIAVPSPTHHDDPRFVGSVSKLGVSVPNLVVQAPGQYLPQVNQRIRLVSMPNDPAPIAPGSLGVVTKMRDFGEWAQIEVDWENGRPILMSIPPDGWEPAE